MDVWSTIFLLWMGLTLVEQGVGRQHVQVQVQTPPRYSDDPNVVVLTRDTFTPFIKSHRFVLVVFHTPWCVFSRRFEPEFSRAAATALHDHTGIVFAAVDCDTQPDVRDRFHVLMYPVLLFFTDGKYEKYDGPRNAESLLHYSYKMARPSIHLLHSMAEMDTFIEEHEVVMMGAFGIVADGHTSKSPREVFHTVAEKFRPEYPYFGEVVNQELVKGFGRTNGTASWAVAIRFRGLQDGVSFRGSWTVKALDHFVEQHALPLLPELRTHNFKGLMNNGLRGVMVFVDLEHDPYGHQRDLLNVVRETARIFEPSLRFSYVNWGTFHQLARKFGVHGDPPAIVALDASMKHHTAFSPGANLTVSELSTFCDGFLSGRLPITLRSAALVRTDTRRSSVEPVTATTFVEDVLEPSWDTVLYIYTPWCGFCKRANVAFHEVSTRIQDNGPAPAFLSFDAEANDLDPALAVVTAYPTILMYQGERDNRTSIEYTGRATIDEMMTFFTTRMRVPRPPVIVDDDDDDDDDDSCMR